MSVIHLDHIKKDYGKHRGTRDVSFSVERGEIFGFVGPNGAGKSTTIKVLLGFIFAGGGSATIDGLDVARQSKQIKRFTAYVPSDVRLYSGMRVGELLKRNAGFYPPGSLDEAVRLCALFDVDQGKRFSELSTGNKKKVSLVCALMSGPRVIILDEPTGGLDPVMQKKLFSELTARAQRGATVLLSSHNLPEVQEYCDRVAFIKDGRILAVTDLKDQAVQKIVTVTGGRPVVPDGLELISREKARRMFRTALSGPELLRALTALDPDDFTVEDERMEERFWSLYGREEAAKEESI